MTEHLSKAAQVAANWAPKVRPSDDDLDTLPKNVAEGVRAVVAASVDIDERVKLCEALWKENPGHELALEPGNHPQTSWAQRFEEVGGEIVEIVKESAGSRVQIIYRPRAKLANQIDPAAALQARLSGPKPEPEDTGPGA